MLNKILFVIFASKSSKISCFQFEEIPCATTTCICPCGQATPSYYVSYSIALRTIILSNMSTVSFSYSLRFSLLRIIVFSTSLISPFLISDLAHHCIDDILDQTQIKYKLLYLKDYLMKKINDFYLEADNLVNFSETY